MSTATQLASVQAAIAAIEGGAQEYHQADGRSARAADLQTLYDREAVLLQRQADEAGTRRIMAVGTFRGPA